jgi:DNA invertase Pin-like site-specific DNA recombinase
MRRVCTYRVFNGFALFDHTGFTLISVAEPDLMANDLTRKLMRQLMGAVAEYEKSQLVIKLRAARLRKKAKTGRCVEGAKPYGEYEGEAEVIERMKDLRAEGMGFDRIAAKLNEEGIRPRRGPRWWGLTVNKILTGKGRVVA